MNPEELIENMKNLTRELSSMEGDVTEDELAKFMENVTQSLDQVFTLAQNEIDQGLQQIEAAKTHLTDQGLHNDAALMEPLLGSILSAQNQLKIGKEAAQHNGEFEGHFQTPTPEKLLTASVLAKFEALEKLRSESNSP